MAVVVPDFQRTVRKTSEHIICRYRLESARGLYAGDCRDGWRMQKRISGENEHE
jgi:hypothetical protein